MKLETFEKKIMQLYTRYGHGNNQPTWFTVTIVTAYKQKLVIVRDETGFSIRYDKKPEQWGSEQEHISGCFKDVLTQINNSFKQRKILCNIKVGQNER